MEENELLDRMMALGMTYADVGRGLRQQGLKGTTVTLTVLARRVILNPSGAKEANLEKVIAALGGKLKISWINEKAYKKRLRKEGEVITKMT